MLDASLIIVNWKVRDYLKRCLESIYRYAKGIDFEVFVVDNDSRDGSPDMVRESFPQVNMIANNKNLGFARANNLALARCKGRYILFLNPDTELVDNSIKSMVEFMDSHPDVSALGPKLIYPDGSLQRSCRHFPSLFTDLMGKLCLDWLFPSSSFFNYYRMGSWQHDTIKLIDVPYGACLLVRKKTLEDIGFMDERFFMYYDEIDLCYRIKKNGGRVYFVPDIKVVHHLNRSSSQVPFETERYAHRSKLLFFKKHYGPLAVTILFITLYVQTAILWAFFSIRLLLTGKGNNAGHYKRYFSSTWSEYLNFLREKRS